MLPARGGSLCHTSLPSTTPPIHTLIAMQSHACQSTSTLSALPHAATAGLAGRRLAWPAAGSYKSWRQAQRHRWCTDRSQQTVAHFCLRPQALRLVLLVSGPLL